VKFSAGMNHSSWVNQSKHFSVVSYQFSVGSCLLAVDS
jgi:hypothetical protein